MSEDRPAPEARAREFREADHEAEVELADRAWHTLRSAMNGLSPMERTVLALHRGFAYSRAEVADILHVEESEVAAVVESVGRRLRARSPVMNPVANPAEPSEPDAKNARDPEDGRPPSTA